MIMHTQIPHQAKYNRDPEALEWARASVQRYIDQYQTFEDNLELQAEEARRRGEDPEKCKELDKSQKRWRMMKNMLKMNFIGGEGCVVACFDERWPSLADAVLGDYLHD